MRTAKNIAMRTLQVFFAILTTLFFVRCTEAGERVSLSFQNPDGSTSPDISAEVVHTQAQRSLGLMYRKELGERQGMLFVFPRPDKVSFWMKNTYLELDMIFLDEHLVVVHVEREARPLTETPRPSSRPAQYVLEVRGGFAKKWGVLPGSRLSVSGEIPQAQN